MFKPKRKYIALLQQVFLLEGSQTVNVHVMMVLWGQSIIIDFDIDIDVNTDMDISILTLILMLDHVFGRLKIFPWVSLLFPAK